MNDDLYNVAFERSILNSFLFEPVLFDRYKRHLNAKTFYLPSHQNIFNAMEFLTDNETPLDEEFIKKRLIKLECFDEQTLLEIMSVNPISNIESYIVEVQNKHKTREVNAIALQLQHGQLDISLFKIALDKIEKLYEINAEEEEELLTIDFKRLSPFLGNLTQDLMKLNSYPASMVLTTVLSSMAGLIGARAKISNNTNITVFPVIWSMIVAPSSLSAKSTLFKFTKKCIFDNMQNELFDTYDEELKEYKDALKRYTALSRDEKGQEEEPEKPHPKLLIFANDSTPEAKLISLSRNTNGGVVYFDEMKAELEKSNSNPAYKALKTSMFEGELYHKELVKDGGTTFILRNPVLSEVGLITEQWLIESVQKNDIASGFMARYLFSYNKRSDFKPLQIQNFLIDDTKYSKVGRFILDMFKIDAEKPVLFNLTQQAEQYYREWFNDFSKTAYAVETDEEITASYRLSTYVLKFALIIYIFNSADKLLDIVASDLLKVGIEEIKSAIYLLEIFQHESHKVLNLFERNKKLNFKIDDVIVKLQKKIRATETKMLTKTQASNGIRGLTSKKLNELVEMGLFKITKQDRKTYIMEA
jgi:hypothetical protein